MRETGSRLSRGLRVALALALCALTWAAALVAEAAADPSWKIVDLPGREANLHSISCPSASLCVGVGSPAFFATSTAPAGDASAWQTSSFPPVDRLDGELLGVDCPSASLCVAVEYDGTILSTTNPTAGATAWNKVQVPGAERLRSVSCPRTSLCVAVGEGGEVVSSTAPSGGPDAWEVAELGTPLRAISCASALCVAVGPQAVLSSIEPRRGSGGWQVEQQDPLDPRRSSLSSIDCPTASFCLAGDGDGVRVTANPLAPFSGWQPTSLSSGFQVHGTGCTAADHCVATTDDGAAFASTNPLGGSSAWSAAQFEGGRSPDGLFAVSCPSEALCVAGGGFGQIASSTNPFEAPTTPPPPPMSRPKRPRTLLLGRHHRRLRLKGGRKTIGVRFQFTANGAFSGFRCRLDGGRPRSCRSPKAFQLSRGKHVFSVQALGPGGADRTPEAARVEILGQVPPRPGR